MEDESTAKSSSVLAVEGDAEEAKTKGDVGGGADAF